MASNEVNVENTNASGSDEILDFNSPVSMNPLVLLVQIEHVNGRPIESEILMEASFTELCLHTNPVHTLNAGAKTLWDQFFVHYGFPEKILLDQGRNFESQLISEL